MDGGDGDVVLLRIPTRDPARAAAFYERLFGWRVVAATGGALDFATPGGLRGVFRVGEPSSAGPEIYVRVTALEGALAEAIRLGATALVRPGASPGGGRVAQVLDPEGNRIGLLEGPRRASGDPLGGGATDFPSNKGASS